VPFVLSFLLLRKRILFFFKRKKFYKNNTIIPEYEIKDFNPLEVSFIANGYLADKHISAQIVWLAVSGFVRISEKDGQLSFEKIKDSPSLSFTDKKFIETINAKKESDFSTSDYRVFQDTIASAIKSLIARDYISGHSNFKGLRYGILFLSLFLAINPGIFIFLFLGYNFLVIWSGTCVLYGLLSMIFFKKSGILTDKGLELERNFLGVKKYIEIAEVDRIKFHNNLEKTPVLFEKLLPYAMVFGLEKKWANEFEDIYKNYTPPFNSATQGIKYPAHFYIDKIKNPREASFLFFVAPQITAASYKNIIAVYGSLFLWT
jgi:hypothetical protein